MNPKRIQKKVGKLRKKGKLTKAIELQRQLCQEEARFDRCRAALQEAHG
jgi:hypothetical protein